ncbi:MAG: hypothetical protein ACU84Q_02170, partial [Gammaproteobacteria bacterium]
GQSRKLSVRLPIPRLLVVWAVLSASLQIYNLTTPGIAWPYLFGVFSLVINGFSVFLLLLFKSDWDDEKPT